MSLTHADNARLAHRVLRLKESGIDSENQIKTLAARGRKAADRQEGGNIGFGGAPHEAIAMGVDSFLDPEQEGATDPKRVEKLFGMSLSDIWKAWDEATTANLEEVLDNKALTSWRKSVEEDQRTFEERAAQMEETGDWPVHPYFGHNRHLEGAANALYDSGREGFLDATIDWDTSNTKVALVDSAVYTVNLATHKFMSSVASVVATTAAQSGKTVTAGVADANDDTFTAATGAQSEALIVYQSSAVTGGADVANTAQRLIAYIDTATGLPVTPNGGNIVVTWDSGSNRIFKL